VIYVGINKNADRKVFSASAEPTRATHGESYCYVIGPFRTRKGAEFMRDCGKANPHVQTVSDAERLAHLRQYGKGAPA